MLFHLLRRRDCFRYEDNRSDDFTVKLSREKRREKYRSFFSSFLPKGPKFVACSQSSHTELVVSRKSVSRVERVRTDPRISIDLVTRDDGRIGCFDEAAYVQTRRREICEGRWQKAAGVAVFVMKSARARE